MTATTTLQASSQSQLRQFIEQIERLTEEAKATADDIRDKYAEAKALGFDPKIMKKIVSLRKKSKADREEEEALLETYMHALGMLDGTPMGDWMAKKDAEEPIAARPVVMSADVSAAVETLRKAEEKGAQFVAYGGSAFETATMRKVLEDMGAVKPRAIETLVEQTTAVVGAIVDEALAGKPARKPNTIMGALEGAIEAAAARGVNPHHDMTTTVQVGNGPKVSLDALQEEVAARTGRSRRRTAAPAAE